MFLRRGGGGRGRLALIKKDKKEKGNKIKKTMPAAFSLKPFQRTHFSRDIK